MATRNERKKRAKETRLMLETAVSKAFADDAARKAAAKLTTLDSHPTDTFRTVRQVVSSRSGVVQRGKFVSRQGQPSKPLEGDWRERKAAGYFGGKRLVK